ncbi:FixH family protein [Mucilaginibacter sp. Mucisp86]|uniref:FixH family protein n=1 Tax=Mucilaginibacter sp. Mucisp86 TaxID=3243060 RepID=UPI0039B697E1
MNWGKGIIMGMAIFMLFILSMCIYMFNVPVDDYDHQYYEKGMSFNKDHNREEQVIKDHAEPVITQQGDRLSIAFSMPATGRISFMRPSDKTQDKAFQFNNGAGKTASISLKDMAKGPWQLILEWESCHKAYLYHKEVFIK